MKSLITSVMPKTYHYDQKRLINRPRAMIARILRETNWYIEKNWIITNLSTRCNFNKWDASHHNLSTDYQWMRINRSPTTIASTKPLNYVIFFSSKNDLITFGERILSELTICNWPLSSSVMAQNRNIFSCQIFGWSNNKPIDEVQVLNFISIRIQYTLIIYDIREAWTKTRPPHR